MDQCSRILAGRRAGDRKAGRVPPLPFAALFAVVLVFGVASSASAGNARTGTTRTLAHGSAAIASHASGSGAIEPQVCSGCTPPLVYGGGPVMSTNGAKGLTVTPIYWQPSGGRYAFPAKYVSLLNGYITNVAAASSTTDNIYSVDTEYYDIANGIKTFITYTITAATPILDADAFPANGCKPAAGMTVCITDAQLRTELRHLTSTHHLTTDLAHFYPVFFPPGVETMDVDGTTSAGAYCGYHRAFGSGKVQTVYGDLTYPPSNGGCDTGQAPNGNLRADGELSTFAHELNEAITDPLAPQYAWFDGKGNEIGDMCDNDYGGALGSTNRSNPSGTEYNQVINGGKYYTQALFSNLAYAKSGVGKGCALSEALAQHPAASGTGGSATTVVSAFADATPTTLAADGKATSTVVVTVGDAAGNAVAGDHLHFSTGLQYGSGTCGTLNSSHETTNANGSATVTYTASTSNVQCWILAVEAEGGRAAQSVVYQGTSQKNSPALDAAFPKKLQSGGTTSFTMKEVNPSSHAVPDARVDFYIYRGESNSKAVKASQVHVTDSTNGPNGTFVPLPMTGSTAAGNAIWGYLGPYQGTTMAPDATKTITYHVTLASSVPTSKTAPLFGFEGYIDQVNSSSGSGTTLADTYASNVEVPTEAQQSLAWWQWLLIGIGALLVVALAALGVVAWRKRRHHPEGPAPAPAA